MPEEIISIEKGQLFITNSGPAQLIEMGTQESILRLIADGSNITVGTNSLPMLRADQRVTFLRELISARALDKLPDGTKVTLEITNPSGGEIISFGIEMGKDMTMYDGN